MPRGRPPRVKTVKNSGENEKSVKSSETVAQNRFPKKRRDVSKDAQSGEVPVENGSGLKDEKVRDNVDQVLRGRKRGRPRKEAIKLEDSESAQPALSCEICHKQFKFKATLKQHEQIHYGIKKYECQECHRRFLHKGTLTVHMRIHTGELPYHCPHCPKRFRGQTALDCHVFRHTKQGAKCPQCDSVFATASIVKQHIREVHTTERSHTCQICGITYKHRKTLRLHLGNHQKRICPECGRVFHSVYAMMTHRKIHAQDHYQFRCVFCDRKFEKLEELHSHSKLRGRTFQCEMCCHSFNKADYLDNHNRRFHWKELGLEQLKVAAPKNGWNRKGVPKRKKVEQVDGKKSIDPALQETVVQTIEVKDPPEIGHDVQYDVIHFEEIPAETKIMMKTITTEIEPVLPQSLFEGALETENDGVQDYDGAESNGDYNDHDYSLIGQDESEVGEVPKRESTETNVEPESSEQRECDTKQSTESDAIDPPKELVTMKKESPQSSSLEDDEPLSNLLTEKVAKDESTVLKEECKQELLNPKEEPHSSTEDRSSDTESTKTKQESSGKKGQRKFRKMQCLFCGDSFKGRTALKEHKLKQHAELIGKSGPFVCELCGKKYATSSSLVVHRSKHAENQRFKCDVPNCGKAFVYRCYLDNHKRAEHLQERLVCQKCGKLFKYPQDLKVHTRQHEDEKPFKCDLCPSSFRFPSALRCHKARHVAAVFTCDICDKQFKYANSLRVHKKLHTGIKRFQCEICCREFNTKAPLVRHLAIHSIEREMKCVACDKIFYKKIELVIHQTKEHPNHPMIGRTVKIHTCPVCGQEFTKKSNLNSHAYIHGDEYKYVCNLCENQKFKQHAGLRHHLTNFHKLEIRKRKPKEVREQENVVTVEEPPQLLEEVTSATLTPAISVLHNGVEFMLQQVQCE